MSDVASIAGLSSAEAARRLAVEGANALPSGKRRTLGVIALETLRQPMFLLLLSAAALYLVLGEPAEGVTLLGAVVFTVTITLVQEGRSERALDALRNLASPRALVVRDGARVRIAGADVVRGDLLVLGEGDRVPADGFALEANELSADESSLTGESVTVRKVAVAGESPPAPAPPGGDDLPFVFAGTMIAQGQGLVRVTATGSRSEIGRLGKALGDVVRETSPLHAQIARLVRTLATVGISLSVVLVVVHGLLNGDWIAALLAGIALAMALLPEEYPVVLAIFPAIGAWRLAKEKVLTRRLAALETLGATSVLCVDKTGTLTENRMSVARLFAQGATLDIEADSQAPLPEAFHALVEDAILASEIEPFDPMERAFHAVGRRFLANTEHLHGDWTLVHEYALTPELLAMSHVWRAKDRSEHVVAAKGAPEAIVDLCHLAPERAQEIAAAVDRMAADGLRVLGVARALFKGDAWPDVEHDFDFVFTGLIGLADPLRPGIPEAVRQCGEAGVRVIMITGDYPTTARAIARQAGLAAGEPLAGDAMERLDDDALRERLRTADVCARITPTQKLRIVRALQADGAVVAMTGDGVNDAPALKAAHVGIAMGGRGTDVAREAASLVLLDDNFASIVAAVRGGRRIFANLRKSMSYIMAVHVPIAGMALVPTLVGWPLLLSPLHLAFLELLIDPSCSLAFEADPPDDDAMQRPPRRTDAPLFGRKTIVRALTQGAAVLVSVFGAFLWARGRVSESEARTIAFITLVVGNLALIYVDRAGDGSFIASLRKITSVLVWVTTLTLLGLAMLVMVPFLAHAFRFERPGPASVAVAFACGVGGVWACEAARRFMRGRD